MKYLYDECHRRFSYDRETGFVFRKLAISRSTKVGDKVGSINGGGYLYSGIGCKRYRLHRLIWLMETGEMPEYSIDHINGIKTDNRWCNLRECTHSQNMSNRGLSSRNTVGFKGVSPAKSSKINPFMAQLRHKKETIYLGYFKTAQLAHEAYTEASKKYHGEFSNNGVKLSPDAQLGSKVRTAIKKEHEARKVAV